MKEAMNKRVSRRSYKDIAIDTEKKKKIINWIDEINKESGLSISYKEDGSQAFNSFGKSYGMFKNVRSILLMKGKKDDKDLKEKIGYFGEELILNITKIGLGTCWVGGTFDKKNVSKIEKNEELVCVVTVGVVEEKKTLKEKIIGAVTHRNRKSINERFESKDTPPSWVKEGMEAVILAPSALNSQKALFVYDNGVLSVKIADDYEFAMVDLGIAKRHFELAAKGKFDFGNGAKFYKNL